MVTDELKVTTEGGVLDEAGRRQIGGAVLWPCLAVVDLDDLHELLRDAHISFEPLFGFDHCGAPAAAVARA
jgi:hypothetical protein